MVILGVKDSGLLTFSPGCPVEGEAEYLFLLFKYASVGNWMNWHICLIFITGVLDSQGNVQSNILTKIVTEAVIMCEQTGLYVVDVCCDGAGWNRATRRNFGEQNSLTSTECSTAHSVDQKRRLFFISDFLHLIKYVRNMLLNTFYNTHRGKVSTIPCHWFPCSKKEDMDKKLKLSVRTKNLGRLVHTGVREKWTMHFSFNILPLALI